MADLNKSTIVRSWPTTIKFLIGFLVSAGVSTLLFMTIVSGTITAGIACIPAVVALICLYMAFSGAGVCPCPGCGKEMAGLSTGSNDGHLCSECLQYFEGTGGQLWATDQSRVADSPLFSSPLPEKFTFPDKCCVCAKPQTHRQTVSMTQQNASSAITATTIGVTTTTRTSVEVPHCADHKDGAGLGGSKDHPHIRFRSYPYLREFCELNGTKPG